MKALRIVFMGTPEFAVASLDTLVTKNYNVVGVVTAPDKPAGRGRKVKSSDVKRYAEEKNLKLFQPVNLKDPSFKEALEALEPDVIVVVAFRMLPRTIWEIPKRGTFNLHASLLPNYRGAAPINWAIINGESTTGVTTFFIDDKIDTGEIILQESTDIEANDSAGTLHDKLMVQGAALVLRTVELIEEGAVLTHPQPEHGQLKAAPKIYKEHCEINWNANLKEIHNRIRGLNPYPTAWTTLYNGDDHLLLKIYSGRIEEEQHDLKNGQLLFSKKEIKVATPGGFIQLEEVQLAGKKRMPTRELLNGLNLEKTAYLA